MVRTAAETLTMLQTLTGGALKTALMIILVVWSFKRIHITVQKSLQDRGASWWPCTFSTDENIAEIREASWQIDSGVSGI